MIPNRKKRHGYWVMVRRLQHLQDRVARGAASEAAMHFLKREVNALEWMLAEILGLYPGLDAPYVPHQDDDVMEPLRQAVGG